MPKQNKIILVFLIFVALLASLFFIINYIKNANNTKPLPPPPVVNNTDPEPQLDYLTRDNIIKHIEWTYRNGKSYEQVALVTGGPRDYVVTAYQPDYRGNSNKGGGVIVFDVSNKQPKIIWESTEDISLTMPEVLDVRDITGDGKVEIISQWSDEKLSFLYLYSWNGNTFNFITPTKKVTGLIGIGGSGNLYALVFGVQRGDIQVKDLDGDNIDEVIISGNFTRDEAGNEIPVENETIFKWDIQFKWDTQKQEYYFWKEEKINE